MTHGLLGVFTNRLPSVLRCVCVCAVPTSSCWTRDGLTHGARGACGEAHQGAGAADEVVVASGEQGVGMNAGADGSGRAKDGELETISEPGHGGRGGAHAAAATVPRRRDGVVAPRDLLRPRGVNSRGYQQPHPEKRNQNPLAVSPLRPTRVLSGGSTGSGRGQEAARKGDAESARRGNEGELAGLHGASRLSAKQEEHSGEAPLAAPHHGSASRALSATQQHQLNAQRAQHQEAQLLRGPAAEAGCAAAAGAPVPSSSSCSSSSRGKRRRERLLLEQSQLRHEEERGEQRAQALQRQINHHNQQQQQEQQQLQQQQEQHMRMLEEAAEEQRFMEEMGPPAARGHTVAQAPLNFAHFSRAAHLYSRGHLKNPSAERRTLQGPCRPQHRPSATPLECWPPAPGRSHEAPPHGPCQVCQRP